MSLYLILPKGINTHISAIVRQIAHGATFEEIMEGYPDLERKDIQQAIEYIGAFNI